MRVPLAVIEGVVCSIVWAMPAVVSSEVFWGEIRAEGDIVQTVAVRFACSNSIVVNGWEERRIFYSVYRQLEGKKAVNDSYIL